MAAFFRRVRASLPTGPPGPLFHATILCCQTGGLAFGIRAYISEGDKERQQRAEQAVLEVKRREAASAIHALDRTLAYFNSVRFYRLVLELEAYRVKMERRASFVRGQTDWAEEWLDRRVRLDPEAVQMEQHRVELKNLWYLSKQSWEDHPAQRRLMYAFFYDAPLNSALAVRSLRLLEPMDQARYRRRGFDYVRPSIYPFIASLYGIADPDGGLQSADSQPWWFMQATRQ